MTIRSDNGDNSTKAKEAAAEAEAVEVLELEKRRTQVKSEIKGLHELGWISVELYKEDVLEAIEVAIKVRIPIRPIIRIRIV